MRITIEEDGEIRELKGDSCILALDAQVIIMGNTSPSEILTQVSMLTHSAHTAISDMIEKDGGTKPTLLETLLDINSTTNDIQKEMEKDGEDIVIDYKNLIKQILENEGEENTNDNEEDN